MADSIREVLIQRIVTALQSAGGPSGLTVHRARARPIKSDTLPAQVVYVIEEETTIGGASDSSLARHVLTVHVESRVVGDPPDQALDPLTTWAVRQLLADRRWGGLAVNTVEQKTAWVATEEDQVYGAALQAFTLDYLTLADDATSQG